MRAPHVGQMARELKKAGREVAVLLLSSDASSLEAYAEEKKAAGSEELYMLASLMLTLNAGQRALLKFELRHLTA